MGVLTRIGLGWRFRVGNGQTKSGVLTSKGYRSWMAESDQGSSEEEGMGSPGPGMGIATRVMEWPD